MEILESTRSVESTEKPKTGPGISIIAKTKINLFSMLKKKRTAKFMTTAASALNIERRSAVEGVCQRIREYMRKNLKGGKAGRYIKSGGKKGRSADIQLSLAKLEENINNTVRFSVHPIHAALVASLAFSIESKFARKTPIIAAEFAHIAADYGNMACKMLDCIILDEGNEEERWKDVIHKRISGHSVLDLALILELYEFLTHPFVVKFVDTAWVGDISNLVQHSGFDAPDVYDFIEEEVEIDITFDWFENMGVVWLGSLMKSYSKKMTQDFAEGVSDLLDPTLIIKSPFARFVFNFVFFLTRVGVQQAVLVADYSPGRGYNFTTLEIFHIILAIGFLMGEIQELKIAYLQGGTNLRRYWEDVFNWLDWGIQFVFVTYLGFTVWAQKSSIEGDEDLARDHYDWGKKVLAGNSILLWVRMLDYLSIHKVLGPAVRTLSLMVKDLTTFTVMFAFVIIGFASAFNVWFHVSPGFETLPESMLTLFTFSLGEFKFDDVAVSSPLFGQVALVIFLFIGTIMLLNLLIAILSYTFDHVQQKSYDEYRLGKAKIFANMSWDEADIFIKGVPLPAALNLFRVITFPLGLVLGEKLEKTLNLLFFVIIIDVALMGIVTVYTLLFLGFNLIATAHAGTLLVLVGNAKKEEITLALAEKAEEDKEEEEMRNKVVGGGDDDEEDEEQDDDFLKYEDEKKGSCNYAERLGRASTSAVDTVLNTLTISAMIVFMLVKNIVVKLPTILAGACCRALHRQKRMIETIVHHGKIKKAKFSRAEKQVISKWKKAARKALDISKGKESIKWSDMKKILDSSGIARSNYELDHMGEGGVSEQVGDQKFDVLSLRVGKYRRSTSRRKRFRGSSAGGSKSGSGTSKRSDASSVGDEDDFRDDFSVAIYNAFFYKGVNGNSHIGMGEEDEDFYILYKDFIVFMMSPYRSRVIRTDGSDVLPFVGGRSVIELTNAGLLEEEERERAEEEEEEEEEEEKEEVEKEKKKEGGGEPNPKRLSNVVNLGFGRGGKGGQSPERMHGSAMINPQLDVNGAAPKHLHGLGLGEDAAISLEDLAKRVRRGGMVKEELATQLMGILAGGGVGGGGGGAGGGTGIRFSKAAEARARRSSRRYTGAGYKSSGRLSRSQRRKSSTDAFSKAANEAFLLGHTVSEIVMEEEEVLCKSGVQI